MDYSGLSTMFNTIFGILALVGFANLLDFGFRTMAQNKANRAETSRVSKWGLPAPRRPEEPRREDHLWHF